MAATDEQGFHTETGYRAVDAITYRIRPEVIAHHDSHSGILMYDTVSYGAGEMNTMDRSGSVHDLLFLSRGAGTQAFGHVAGSRFEIAPNRLLRTTFVPAEADTSVTCGTSARSLSLMFPKGYLERLLRREGMSGFPPLLFQEQGRLTQLIRMMEREIAAPGFATSLMIEGLSRAIAVELARLARAQDAEPPDRIWLAPARLRRILDYIEAHLDQPVTLDELARLVDLSPYHFIRMFRREVGATPYRYVCDRRIARARALLAETELPIAEVARLCGFVRHAQFSAAFARAVGIAPMQYRRSHART